jgi:hypothetical protein
MHKKRVSDKSKIRFREKIRNVIDGLSRTVSVVRIEREDCTNCYHDRYTGTSVGKCKWTKDQAEAKQLQWESTHPDQLRYKYFDKGRCPVCRGGGSLDTEKTTNIKCTVIWNPESRFGNDTMYTVAGADGNTIVMLKTKPMYIDMFKNQDLIIVVDGVKCKVSKPPVLRGLGNQSLLIVTCFTTDKPKPGSGEVVKDYY